MSQRNGRMGRVLSPRHTLPPNTTCTYYFHGFPSDLIWLSFTSHHLQVSLVCALALQNSEIDFSTFHPIQLLQPVTHDNLTAVFGQVSFPLMMNYFFTLNINYLFSRVA